MNKLFDGNTYLRQILSDAEIQQLQAFNANPLMKEAVRKVLLMPIYYQGTLQGGQPPNPLFNFALGFVSSNSGLTDEQAGRYLKVQAEGINAVEIAFNRISEFQAVSEPLPPANDAI